MIVDNKNAPPPQTYRAQYDAPQGPPPGYQQGSTDPLASRGYPPSPNYSSSPGGEAAPFYNQHPELAQGSSSQYLSPEPSPSQPRSPSPSSSSSGFFAKSASLESLLNPPPPAFARAPQAQFPYPPFAPCAAVSLTAGLDGGFPLMPPPGAVPGAPHPFATHDVNEEDWTRFLGDLKKIGTLSPTNRIVANVAPLAMGVGFFPGFLITRALEGRMKTKKLGPASQLVDYWNSYYFRPRMMEVSLIHGRTVYGSSGGLPQEMVHQGYRRREDFDSDSSSSSSSDSEDDRDRRRMGRDERRAQKREHRDERRAERREHRDERRAEKRARREERRAARRERKSRRREAKADKKEPWRLVVSYRPPAAM